MESLGPHVSLLNYDLIPQTTQNFVRQVLSGDRNVLMHLVHEFFFLSVNQNDKPLQQKYVHLVTLQ